MSVKEKPSFSKLSQIAEILGLLDETNRGKQWLVDQLKKHKISVKNTINNYKILKECPDDFLSQMLRSLKGEDIAGFEDIKTLTKTYHWFFTDIVAGYAHAVVLVLTMPTLGQRLLAMAVTVLVVVPIGKMAKSLHLHLINPRLVF